MGTTMGDLLARYTQQAQMSSFFTNHLTYYNVLDYADGETVNDGSTDATNAILDACEAINTAGGGILYFPYGSYLIESGLDLTTGYFTALTSVKYFGVEGSGSTITFADTFSSGTYYTFFKCTTCNNIYINNLQVVSTDKTALGTASEARERGVITLNTNGACKNIFMNNIHQWGGDVFVATSTLALYATTFTSNVILNNIHGYSVAYGIALQYSGRNVYGRNLFFERTHRAFIGYGCDNVDLEITSHSQDSTDVVISTAEGMTTSNIKIKYTNTATVNAASAAGCVQIKFYDSTPAIIQNVDIDVYIVYPASNYFGYGVYIGKYTDGSTQDTTDRGHRLENVTISGYIQGGPVVGCLPLTIEGTWGTGDYWKNINLDNLVLKDTQSAYWNVNSIVDQSVIKNFSSTGILYITSATNKTIVKDSWADDFYAAGNTSYIDFYNCNFTVASYFNTTNKNYYNCIKLGKKINATSESKMMVNGANGLVQGYAVKMLTGDLTGTNNIFRISASAQVMVRIKYYLVADYTDQNQATRDETYGIKSLSGSMDSNGSWYTLYVAAHDQVTEKSLGTASAVTIGVANGTTAGGFITAACTNYNGANAKAVFEIEVLSMSGLSFVEAV